MTFLLVLSINLNTKTEKKVLIQYKDITKIRRYCTKFNLWNTTKSHFIICLYNTTKKLKNVFLNFKIFLSVPGISLFTFYSYHFREYLYLLFTLIISGNIFNYFLLLSIPGISLFMFYSYQFWENLYLLLSLHQGTFKSYQAHFMRYYWFKFYSQTIKRQSILLKWYFQ